MSHRLENNSRTRAKYMMRKSNIPKVCSRCGSTEIIEVHHIDFNVFNNSLGNLVYLCSLCHGKCHRRLSPPTL